MPRVKVPITAPPATPASISPPPAPVPEPIPALPPITAEPVQLQSIATPVNASRQPWLTKNRLLIAGVVILILVLLGTMVSLFQQRHALQQQLAKQGGGSAKSATDVEALVREVGQYIQLPVGEKPTVITVSDVEKARQQSSFFAKAENGDKVLLYNQSKQAILYRPSTKKLIQVAPLSSDGNTAPNAVKP